MQFIFGILRHSKNTGMSNNKAYPSLPQAWGIFGIFLAVSIGAGFAIGAINEAVGAESLSLGNLIGYVVSMAFVIWFAWNSGKAHPSDRFLHFNRVPWIVYPVLIVMTLSMAVVLDPLTNLIPMPEKIKELFELLGTKDIYTLLMVCILGPVLEEVLFRGIILDGFLNRYKPAKAIFWSAFLFGLFHLNPWQFIPGFFIGILLAWIYWKTRSLVPVILVHIVNNSLSYTIMYVYGKDVESFRDLFTEASEYKIFLLSGVLLLILGLILLYRMLKSSKLFSISNPQIE